jgi:hypothetical protein
VQNDGDEVETYVKSIILLWEVRDKRAKLICLK